MGGSNGIRPLRYPLRASMGSHGWEQRDQIPHHPILTIRSHSKHPPKHPPDQKRKAVYGIPMSRIWWIQHSQTDSAPDFAPDSAPDSAPGSAPGSAPDSAPDSAHDSPGVPARVCHGDLSRRQSRAADRDSVPGPNAAFRYHAGEGCRDPNGREVDGGDGSGIQRGWGATMAISGHTPEEAARCAFVCTRTCMCVVIQIALPVRSHTHIALPRI